MKILQALVVVVAVMVSLATLGMAKASERVERLVRELSLKEKVGQMTQMELSLVLRPGSQTVVDERLLQVALGTYGVGSFLNSPYSGQANTGGLSPAQWQEIIGQIQDFARRNTSSGIPIIFGLDSLHGANYVTGATLFPHNLALASSFNLDLARQSAIITAQTREAGVHWIFGPDVENFLTPLWPRAYETFGEDPLVCALFGAAMVEAIQGEDLSDPSTAAACLKHYLGYGQPRSGKDRTDAWIPDNYLREYFMRPFKAGIEAGAATIMANSGSINGVPVHASYDLLTTMLREELGFEGVLVSDWEDIKKLSSYHRLTDSEREATKIAILAGIDMSMVPYTYSFSTLLLELVEDGEISEERIDLSVTRILDLKERLGLLDDVSSSSSSSSSSTPTISEEVALAAARESVILAKNNGILPLSWLANGEKVLVTGPTANSIKELCGGWTIHWQGMIDDSEAASGASLFAGLSKVAPHVAWVHQPGCSFDSCDSAALENARLEALSSSAIILAVGEPPYAESPGNINDVFLGQGQQELYHTLKSTGKPIILVVIEGRPRVLGPPDQSEAILFSFLPCNQGGQALAEVLMGYVNPSAKMPFSYPRNTGDLDVYYHKPWGSYSQGSDSSFHDPLYAFGFGLSYTSFKYSGLSVSPTSVTLGSPVEVTCTCTNTGAVAGKEVALVYLRQLYRLAVTPEDKMLKTFQKFELQPGEAITLRFTITPEDMAFYAKGPSPIIETGRFEVLLADLSASFVVV